MWISRQLTDRLKEACSARPAVLLTGARQTGKSSLLKKIFPHAEYVTFDHLPVATEAENNPGRFLDRFQGPVLLDEVQYVPSLFRELKIRIDQNRTETGRWILTGSQRFSLMKEISESLAGRIRILSLETLSAQELRDCKRISRTALPDLLWKGGYPELWANPNLTPDLFYEDYIQTYLEKDLRTLINISNLRDFRRFIQVCATRCGQLINYTDISKDLGVSAPTVKTWVHALEATGIIYLLPPFFANIGKRLIKAPKLYFADNGLLCHLLNIPNHEACLNSPVQGAIWENLVFTELVKTQQLIPGRSLFFYRDQNGVEIDFITETQGQLTLIEAKAAERVDPRKLNFAKVAPLLADRNASCQLMHPVPDKTPRQLDGYLSLNPVLHPLA